MHSDGDSAGSASPPVMPDVPVGSEQEALKKSTNGLTPNSLALSPCKDTISMRAGDALKKNFIFY